MDLEKCRYIVVEGPIGAGKTSLARHLAHRVDAETLLERPRTIRFSRASTTTWRASRCRRSSLSCSSASTSCAGVASSTCSGARPSRDFLLDKDPLFARLNLTDAEYALYEKVYSHLKPQTPTPDLVIYLQAPVETLIERVHRRGVDYERTISGALSRAPRRCLQPLFLPATTAAPLLIVNSERLNFVDDPEHFELLRRAHRRDARPARVLQSRPSVNMSATP